MKTIIKQHHIDTQAADIADVILDLLRPSRPIMLYGVPRGGIPAAYAVQNAIQKRSAHCEVVESPEACHVIIDDIIASGRTRDLHSHHDKPFYALYTKENKPDGWLVFPWDRTMDGDSSADDIPIRLLEYIGEDPTREGLLETPKRFLKAWGQWAEGYGKNPADILKVFEDGAEKCDEMVIVRDIPVYSHCEHHLAPFFGVAHVGYIPDGRIVGLSKLSRLVDIYARRLQVQERLTNQIVDALEEHLKPLGAAVVIECRHLCMESRGIQRQGSATITSAMRGDFRDDINTRQEFMHLIK